MGCQIEPAGPGGRPTEPCANRNPHEGHVYGEPEPVPNWGWWCPGISSDPRPDPDRRYTLNEARAIIKQQECARFGHQVDVMVDAQGEPSRVVCGRCPAVWGISGRV